MKRRATSSVLDWAVSSACGSACISSSYQMTREGIVPGLDLASLFCLWRSFVPMSSGKPPSSPRYRRSVERKIVEACGIARNHPSLSAPRRRLLPGDEPLNHPFERWLALRCNPQSRADQSLKDWRARQLLGGEHLNQARLPRRNGTAAGFTRSQRTRPSVGCQGERKRNRGCAMPHGSVLPVAWTCIGVAWPMAHSRQTRVVQVTGHPPPRAMNSATVSARRLASVCTRAMEAVR